MLIRLKPEQIYMYWENLKEAMGNSVPNSNIISNEALNNILFSLTNGVWQAWVLFRKADEDRVEILGFAITEFTYHTVLDVKNFHVYCIYILPDKHVSDSIFLNAFKVLNTFAVRNQCHRVIGETYSKRIMDLVKKAGGVTDYTLCSIETGFEGHEELDQIRKEIAYA